MAVRLVAGSINRYSGHSTDEKPHIGQPKYGESGPLAETVSARDLPTNSLFYEEDTGRRFIWTGTDWEVEANELAGLIAAMVVQQRETNVLLGQIKMGASLTLGEDLG